MTPAVLELRDGRVEHDGRAVLEVETLEVERGETLTLVGANGAGKSTLLRVLGLLQQPTSGMLYFDGEEVVWRASRLLAQRRRLAHVLQEPLLGRMSVRRNVGLGLRFRGVPARESGRRVDGWLERLHIAQLGDRNARTLSGGEAQRASLARALVLDPEVLFLDEPFAALDAPTRLTLLDDFREILAETRTTTLFATHDRGEARALGDRMAVLCGGRVAQLGAPDDVFQRPKSEEVARFVGVETLLPGHVLETTGGVARVEAGGTRLEVRAEPGVGPEVLVGLRPEDVTVAAVRGGPADPGGSAGGMLNTLTGRVVRVSPAQTLVRVAIDCGAIIVALVTHAHFREQKLEVGCAVHVSFAASAAHLIPKG